MKRLLFLVILTSCLSVVHADNTDLLLYSVKKKIDLDTKNFTPVGESVYLHKQSGKTFDLKTIEGIKAMQSFGAYPSNVQIKFEFIDSKPSREIYINDTLVGRTDPKGHFESSKILPLGDNLLRVMLKSKEESRRHFIINDDSKYKCNYTSEVICEVQ